MEQTSQLSQLTKRLGRVPVIVWFLSLGLVAALIALLVFKVAIGTVVSYGLFALMMGSHFFMHGAHGSHGSQAATGPASETARSGPDQPAGHSGGCH